MEIKIIKVGNNSEYTNTNTNQQCAINSDHVQPAKSYWSLQKSEGNNDEKKENIIHIKHKIFKITVWMVKLWVILLITLQWNQIVNGVVYGFKTYFTMKWYC